LRNGFFDRGLVASENVDDAIDDDLGRVNFSIPPDFRISTLTIGMAM
jgi:hypothetical protein